MATTKKKPIPKSGSPAKPTAPPPGFTNSLGMKFATIPVGGFVMGCPEHEKGWSAWETRHPVRIGRDFLLGIHPVTQAQWRAVMGNNPSCFKGDDLPVEMVSWKDAVAFCKKLGKMDGKKYRLPTEAEWEYACRAGTTTPFHTGPTLSSRQANCYPNGKGPYREQTSRVGAYPPNPWGIFDMHGNVAEWCADFYGNYPPGEALDPEGPPTGNSRVYRGGSWMTEPACCRAARRDHSPPGCSSADLGFRVVLCLGPA